MVPESMYTSLRAPAGLISYTAHQVIHVCLYFSVSWFSPLFRWINWRPTSMTQLAEAERKILSGVYYTIDITLSPLQTALV